MTTIKRVRCRTGEASPPRRPSTSVHGSGLPGRAAIARPAAILLAVVAALLVGRTTPAGADVVLAAADEAMEAEYRQARREALSGGAGATTFAARASGGTRLLLPWFEVDRSAPAGETTLFGVRNANGASLSLTISYLDRRGRQVARSGYSLGPRQTLTINLRDIGALPAESDGVARGMVIVDSSGTLSGDYFHVSPARKFATGDRLVTDGPSAFCRVWDVRYANGGTFDGGTQLTLLVGDPLGDGPRSDQPAAMFEVFDEDGQSWGVVFLWTDQLVNRLSVTEILAALPATPPYGALEVVFPTATGGGLVEADFEAQHQFGVGFDGNCIKTE